MVKMEIMLRMKMTRMKSESGTLEMVERRTLFISKRKYQEKSTFCAAC
jgi:hypothetical protein